MTDEIKRRGRPPRNDTAMPDLPAERPAGTIRVRVIRDFWVGEDRTYSGTILDMEVMSAIDGIETGALSRVKDAD
jgi:hypothetical protein